MSADFLAGYISGAAGIVIGNPLDLIKVRLQADAATSPSRSLSARTLFTGLPAPILTYGALNALLFTSYHHSLALLPRAHDRPAPWAFFVAGAVAGLATFVVSTPTEVVKCRAQVRRAGTSETSALLGSSARLSSWAIARGVWRTEGLRGFYAGGVVTTVRDALGYGFYFATYEVLKDAFAGEGKEGPRMEAARVLLCGGVAGVATWVSVFPLDVIKTRVQTQPSLDVLANRRGAMEISREMYTSEGIRPFFRGLTICCVRAFIVNAAQWAVYEYVFRYLTQQSHNQNETT